MKRRFVTAGSLALVAFALVVLGAAGNAVGASVGVTLTAEGPQPETVDINWGDTVTYSNGDTAEHVIAIPRAEYTSPAIPPGGTLDYAFTGRSGTYRFVQRGKQNHAGEVQVGREGTVTIKVSAEVVPFGKTLVLSGRSTFPGRPVALSVRESGTGGGLKPVLEVMAAADGSYSARVRPQRGGRYQARVAAGQIASDTLSVAVRPRVTMNVSRRTVPAGTTVEVTGRIRPSLAADEATFTYYDTDRKRWVPLQERRVLKNGTVTFRPKVGEGSTRVRIEVRRGSIEPGFATAESRFVRVLGTKP